jgi:hypothetical protein
VLQINIIVGSGEFSFAPPPPSPPPPTPINSFPEIRIQKSQNSIYESLRKQSLWNFFTFCLINGEELCVPTTEQRESDHSFKH